MSHWKSKLTLVTALSLALLLQSSPVALFAHGGGTPQLSDAVAGPYRVFAWTQPEPWRTGEAHVTVAVTLPSGAGGEAGDNLLQEPVTDAQVTVRLTHVSGNYAPIELTAAPQDVLGGAYYDADTPLPAAGEWRVDVTVDGPLGGGVTHFSLEALPTQRVNWLWFAMGGVGLLVLVGLFGLRNIGAAGGAAGRSRTRVAEVG